MLTIFSVLSKSCQEKHFALLHISDCAIETIPEIDFGQVCFDEIKISNLNYLKKN